MSFDPVNDATHALALKQIVGEAMASEMDKHEKVKHVPEQDAVKSIADDVKTLNKEKWIQRGYGTAVATILAYLGFS